MPQPTVAFHGPRGPADPPVGSALVEPFDPRSQYPIGEHRPDLVSTPLGRPLESLTLDALRRGDITDEDFRVTPATLRLQAEVARAAQRPRLAENLERAAELAGIPDDVILDVYTALRPLRSTPEQLEAWAVRLERDYAASAVASLVREAAAAYETRGLVP